MLPSSNNSYARSILQTSSRCEETSFRNLPIEVVHYSMEFLNDFSLMRTVMRLSRFYEDFALDVIYRRNILRGDALLSFIYNYKTIAQMPVGGTGPVVVNGNSSTSIAPLEGEEEGSDSENQIFTNEMFDKLLDQTVYKVIGLNEYCKHMCSLIHPLLLQYSRQSEDYSKNIKKKRKKVLSPSSNSDTILCSNSPPKSSGIVIPNVSLDDAPDDLFKVGEKLFIVKRLHNIVNSSTSFEKVEKISEQKSQLYSKRYFQLITILNLIISIDYLKTWQSSLMNDFSMFRRISNKTYEKSQALSKETRKLEEEAFYFCRELFFCCKRIKTMKFLNCSGKNL